MAKTLARQGEGAQSRCRRARAGQASTSGKRGVGKSGELLPVQADHHQPSEKGAKDLHVLGKARRGGPGRLTCAKM